MTIDEKTIAEIANQLKEVWTARSRLRGLSLTKLPAQEIKARQEKTADILSSYQIPISVSKKISEDISSHHDFTIAPYTNIIKGNISELFLESDKTPSFSPDMPDSGEREAILQAVSDLRRAFNWPQPESQEAAEQQQHIVGYLLGLPEGPISSADQARIMDFVISTFPDLSQREDRPVQGQWTARVQEERGDRPGLWPADPPEKPTDPPAQWAQDRTEGESPVDFIERVYAPWLEARCPGLNLAELRELDTPLTDALDGWVAEHGWPEGRRLPPPDWKHHKQSGDAPPDFIKRHYGPWLMDDATGLVRTDLKRKGGEGLDPSLYTALSNWLTNKRNIIPEDCPLPTKAQVSETLIESPKGGFSDTEAERRAANAMRWRAYKK